MSALNPSYNGDVMAGRPPLKQAPLFGQRLSTLRKSQGMSQRELAQKLETSREMIAYYKETLKP